MMKKGVFFLLIVLLSYCCSLGAQVKDTALIEHKGFWKESERVFLQNPSLRTEVYKHDFSEVYYHANKYEKNVPFNVEEGTGSSQNALMVNTHLKLSTKTAVWGSASYVSEKHKNIQWNSVSDYQLLAPYTIADSVGGNTLTEKYLFSGGYATAFKSWKIGAEMLFRAQQEYRTTDPRMRSIVSDLSVRGGLARNISTYNVSMAGFVNIYKQTNDVDFYKETEMIPELFMSGNGTFNSRFSGKKTGTFYQGGGAGLHIGLQSLASKGLYAHLSLINSRYERIASEFNSFPIDKVYKEKNSLLMGWKHDDNLYYTVFGALTVGRIRGEERVAGSEARGEYPVLTKLTMYKEQDLNAHVGASLGFKGRLWHEYRVQMGYEKTNAQYVYPKRETQHSGLFANVQTQCYATINKRLTLSWQADVLYKHSLSGFINMPFVNMQPSLVRAIRHNYDINTAHLFAINGHVRADYPISKGEYGVFLQVGGCAISVQNIAHQTGVNLSLGLRF